MPESFDLLPLEFFVDPRCLPALVAAEATTAEVEQSKSVENAKDPEMSAPAEDYVRSL